MNFEFLDVLECPYCGSDLAIDYVVNEKDNELIDGCVKCDCSVHAILDGILLINEDPFVKYIIELIRDKRVEEAKMRYLSSESWKKTKLLEEFILPSPFPLKLSHVLGRILSRIARITAETASKKLYRMYSNKSIPFFNLLGKTLFDSYSKHRFSIETFWPIYSFIPLLRKKNERILDLGCGAGHGSFVLWNYIKPQQLCSIDSSFSNLYLARKYLVPEAQLICYDASFSLPLKDGTFSSILMSDGIHDVQSKASLVREMKRTLCSGGLLLLLHAHNSMRPNLWENYPLTPNSLNKLFQDGQLVIKTMPEREVVRDFLFHSKLDLTKKYAEDELNCSNALILVATSDKSLLTLYERVDIDFLSVKDNLVINPIYDLKEMGDKFSLERISPQIFRIDKYPLSEEYLPVKYEIAKTSASGRQVFISDAQKVEDLMRRFVVINVPKNYV